jgi:hypothetical protein
VRLEDAHGKKEVLIEVVGVSHECIDVIGAVPPPYVAARRMPAADEVDDKNLTSTTR